MPLETYFFRKLIVFQNTVVTGYNKQLLGIISDYKQFHRL